jgi:hypothetical protein
MGRMWLGGIRAGVKMFPASEVKAELTLFERIMLQFVNRFGALKVQQILDTTRDQLRKIVDAGVQEGLGQEAIARQITERIPTLSRARARVIARTEVHNAAIYASQEVARELPFPMMKRWISVYDARTRGFGESDGVVDQANHRVMNNVTVPMDGTFEVPNRFGGRDIMSGPADPAAPVYQIANCRCALIYRRSGRPWPTDD